VEESGPGARAAIPAEAAAAGDLVVVSIPPRAYQRVPVQPLAGKKPVLDTINYMPTRARPTAAASSRHFLLAVLWLTILVSAGEGGLRSW